MEEASAEVYGCDTIQEVSLYLNVDVELKEYTAPLGRREEGKGEDAKG